MVWVSGRSRARAETTRSMSWRPSQDNEKSAPEWPEPTLRKDNDEAEPDLGPYKDAYDAAPPETQEAIQAALERKDPDTPLLYELLGSGTPPFKMPQDAADYTDESPKDEQACQNCEFFYVGADGKGICSQVRGEVVGPGWCRLWQSINEESDNESA